MKTIAGRLLQHMVVTCGVLALALTLAGMAVAQEYPARPVRIIVMASPGSSGDVATRLLAPEMSKILGQPLVLENMLGASGLVACRYVAKSAADGYTVLSMASTVLTAPVFMKDVGMDFQKDLAPITVMADGHLLLFTPTAMPWRNFNEMIAYAKANPGKLNTGVPSLQDGTYLFLQAIRQKFGITLVDVPYKGAAAAYTQAIMVNEVQMALGGAAAANAGIANKTIQVVAVSGNRRALAFPDAPTMEELGVQGVDNTLLGLSAPGGTPSAILDKLNAAAVRALQAPDMKERIFKSTGFDVVASSRAEFAQMLATRLQRNAQIAALAGIKPE